MILTAAGILIDQKKIFLVKRVPFAKLYPDCWGCPGGKAEEGETLEETAIREVKEETNLDFKPTELFLKTYQNDREMHRYFGNWEGAVKLQEIEIADAGWFTYEMTRSMMFAFDYKFIIESLHKEKYL